MSFSPFLLATPSTDDITERTPFHLGEFCCYFVVCFCLGLLLLFCCRCSCCGGGGGSGGDRL